MNIFSKVTRTFGDIEAKLVKLGGNPNVVIAVPDIKEFDITEEHDFIMLASKYFIIKYFELLFP